MRAPRVRFTVRGLMVVVVIVALATALLVQQWRSLERERLRAEMAFGEAETARQVANAARTTPPAATPPAPASGAAK